MRKILFILSVAMVASGCVAKVQKDEELDKAMAQLDRVFCEEEAITARKEARIDSLRSLLCQAVSEEETYAVYDALYDEYYKWDCDSALAYAHKKEALARKLQSPALIMDSGADLAYRYIISGMYFDALAAVRRADSIARHPSALTPERAYLMYEIYHGLVQSASDEYASREYRPQEARYLDICCKILSRESIDYYKILTKSLIAQERYEEAIGILLERIADSHPTPQDNAVLHYWVGRVYETMGDERNSTLYYALSARYDLESGNREYRSLICVAQYCFRHGMTEIAYRYITRSYSDTVKADAKIRLIQIGNNLTHFSSAYEQQKRNMDRIRNYISVVVLLFLALLVVATLLLVADKAKLRHANEEIRKSMDALMESNRIKDTYIGQFMSMFSSHIDALERYRSKLRVTSKQMDFALLQQEIRSDDFINEELTHLYDLFDKTFLGLFPNFTDQVNALLKPECRIAERPHNKRLNNELRVLALIRLGVTDSKRIANFLRLSPTTVFNYRVKFRNAALEERGSFEENLKENTYNR